MLDVRRLRVLREVAARGSFSAAAATLGYTQSAVSQHVAALEREAGTTLVERGARGVRLTEAGEALVGHAEAILARLAAAEEELAAIAGLRGGRLRLASFQSGGMTLVPRAVSSFHERHPDVELSLVEAEPAEALERLRAGEIDLALVYDADAAPGDAPDLDRVHLVDDPYDAILPRSHPLARRRTLRLADLREEAWILPTDRSYCRTLIGRASNGAGFEPRGAFVTDELAASQAFVAAGMGVSLLPRLALAAPHPDVVVRPIAGGGPLRRIWAARLARGYRSPASEAMLAELASAAAEISRRAALVAA